MPTGSSSAPVASSRSPCSGSGPTSRRSTGLAAALGCELYDAGLITGLVKVEGPGQTTIPGVFAGGDIASPMHQVSLAVASGTAAALGATRLLIQMDNSLE